MTKRVSVVVASLAFVVACGGSGDIDSGASENLPFGDIDLPAPTNGDGPQQSAPNLEAEFDTSVAVGAVVDDHTSGVSDNLDAESGDDGFSLKLDGLGEPIKLGESISLGTNPQRVELGFEDLSHRYAGIDAFGDDPTLDALWSQCEDGDLLRCDELFLLSPIGSGYETFGDTCGRRTSSAAGTCVAPNVDAVVGGAFGDHPGLDALWAACAAGINDACDDLWGMSAGGSGYEAYGSTCGETTAPTDGGCVEHFGTGSGNDLFATAYGDDPGLDAVYDACATAGAAACDLLFDMSPLDSEYERFAATCGERRPVTFTRCV